VCDVHFFNPYEVYVLCKCCCCRQDAKSGHSLLHLSVKHADTELFGYLVQLPSVDVNLETYSRMTALDIADMLSRRDFMEMLVSCGAQHSLDYGQDSTSESDDVSGLSTCLIFFLLLSLLTVCCGGMVAHSVRQWFLTWGPGTPWGSQTPILGVPNANLEYQQISPNILCTHYAPYPI